MGWGEVSERRYERELRANRGVPPAAPRSLQRGTACTRLCAGSFTEGVYAPPLAEPHSMRGAGARKVRGGIRWETPPPV